MMRTSGVNKVIDFYPCTSSASCPSGHASAERNHPKARLFSAANPSAHSCTLPQIQFRNSLKMEKNTITV